MNQIGSVEGWILTNPALAEARGRIHETADPSLYYMDTGISLYVPNTRFFQRNPREVVRLEAEVLKWLHPIDWTGISYQCVSAEELPPMSCVVLDIETKHADWKDNALLCIGVYDVIEDKVYVVTSGFEFLQTMFDKWKAAGTTVIGHNLMFDLGMLKHICGVRGYVSEDTMLLHYATVQEDRGTHGLKDLGALYCGAPDWDTELRNIKKTYCKAHKKRLSDFTYDIIPNYVLYKYNAYDVKCTAVLWDRLKMIGDGGSELYRTLIKASNVFYEIAARGMLVDTEYLSNLEHHFESIIADSKRIIEEEGFADVNLNSPKQLREALSVVYPDIPITTTEKKFLADLPDTPFLGALRKYKKAQKALSTYVHGIQNCLGDDGRARSGFKLHGTATGRLSSGADDDAGAKLNFQNISRDPLIKRIFIAPPDTTLVQYDMSGCELRVLAALSGDPELGKIFKEGRDLHGEVAASIFGPDFTKEQRVVAKTLNFGTSYGIGPQALQSNIHQAGVEITFREAQQFLSDWKKKFPVAASWLEQQASDAVRGVVPQTIFGRKRRFYPTPGQEWMVANEAKNFQIQSTASDLVLHALCRIHEHLSMYPYIRIVNTVHDSIVFECPNRDSTLHTLDAIVRMEMEGVATEELAQCGTRIPLKVDKDVGTNYAFKEVFL